MTPAEFHDQLHKLGINPGDSLYIRAALARVGIPEWKLTVEWIVDYLGESGTLLVPAFTNSGYLLRKPYPVFDSKSVPNSGALSKLALAHPRVLRSTHPTHSFAAIGSRAAELLEGHDAQAPCFLPVKKFAGHGGTMLLIGCNTESPGFSTVHCVQHDLGLSQRHFLKYLIRADISADDGSLKSWAATESPGCSKSFDKFYPAYIRSENFQSGRIGDAWTIAVSAKEAYAEEYRILKANPRFVDCGEADCLTCGFRGYHLSRLPWATAALCREGIRTLWGRFRKKSKK